jgi:hypothetical protein
MIWQHQPNLRRKLEGIWHIHCRLASLKLRRLPSYQRKPEADLPHFLLE